MQVDNADPRPAYVQVADRLRDLIRNGTLRPGDRLPAGHDLSEQFGVAIMTVRKAIDVLRLEGAVSSQQGRGVFVTAAAAKEPADLESLRVAVERLTVRVAALEDAASQRTE
ncbi:GntR family transcriptional regulator [Kribbella sp. NBC_00889]|jgi:DNA-binding GntR family transcriptional regulator|uniref:GntR family transcriptional regulator n=1 Tax=Kribbella sp. NBC_00889 TaxID=2975974 RepID=UPI0038661479|nr:GntR family transcriptional regulator [Kribbella sp. NBC_00889]